MTKLKPRQSSGEQVFNLRVKVIKAPLVDSRILREILSQRQRAVIL